MRLLIDMNLPPGLCPLLKAEGYDAVHWSTVGAGNASDQSIMAYASKQHFTVVTHDLDFGAILAATHAQGPSVIQVRTQDVLSAGFVSTLTTTLRRFAPTWLQALLSLSMRVVRGCECCPSSKQHLRAA